MKIINKDKNGVIELQMPSGEITKISIEDKWIIEEFPVWGVTGSRSKYVFVERPIITEYSTLRERIYLHRVIVFGKDKKQAQYFNVDHIDMNRLNNVRSNLRKCSVHENMANVKPKNGKKYKGVFYDNSRVLKKPYSAYIDGKSFGLKRNRFYLGRFETAEEAAIAFDNAAYEIHGEFAYLNFPDKIDKIKINEEKKKNGSKYIKENKKKTMPNL